MQNADTIAAVATATGRGGIGVVRVSGKAAAAIAKTILHATPLVRRAQLSNFYDEDNNILDRGIALFFPAPNSYTGEDVLELQGHGGPVVMNLLLKRCVDLGARIAEPGEFTKRAYLNDKIDLAQAEAVADLIDATTTTAARSAARSLQGEFSNKIKNITRSLIDIRMLVEASLDFPEEEIDFIEEADVLNKVCNIEKQLQVICTNARQGVLLRQGAHVVLAGQPNVGKSSLLNRLAGEEIAIVTDIPGTTRDLIRQCIDIQGVPIHIIDTAGLRISVDPVEKIGVEKTWAVLGSADLALIVLDSQAGETSADKEIIKQLPNNLPKIKVWNKIDLLQGSTELLEKDQTIEIKLSAKTGDGVDLLRASILKKIGWQHSDEGLFIARERHLSALNATLLHLKDAITAVQQPELLAEHLRRSQQTLSSITGEFHADDLLGEIFSRFCIGK